VMPDTAGRPAKIVGISQRRTQEAARFQCTMYLEWGSDLSEQLAGLLSGLNSARTGIKLNLEHSVMPFSQIAVGVSAADVLAAFTAQLALV
jgi:hypothetical protein